MQIQDSDMLFISVIDSGLGIHKDNQSKIFKLYGSIKDEKEGINTNGVGLGLVICKLIVEKFNGKIGFISEYNKGSTFFFSVQTEDIDSQNLAYYNEH